MTFTQSAFVDDTADQNKTTLFDNAGEFVEKRMLVSAIIEFESAGLFSDLVLMQNDRVMTEVPKLEAFDRRDNLLRVMPFVKHAERQHEDGILGVHRSKPVIATFVHIHDLTPKLLYLSRQTRRGSRFFYMVRKLQ
ncbi:hypothetical protein [Luteimonas fraxinea]|uniref:Uncharacterized protein n=1 Tax=Luteimonas fraxinea TaxID=2901869 RepID=A0ABS8UFC1_9GAMM|nr:hypothetical protein [Luteimonas fraxinea]